MKYESKVVLELLSNRVFGTPMTLKISESEMLPVVKETVDQAVSAIACEKLIYLCSDASESSFSEAYATYISCMKYNHFVWKQHSAIHNLLVSNGIDYCILKGCASADYYGELRMYRSMGDVDFLVRREDVPRVKELFESKGLECKTASHACHLVFSGKRTHVELHFEIAGIPSGHAGELVREYMSDVLDNTNEIRFDEDRVMRVPDKFHHGIILLMHMQHHLLECGIGLRHLCDWAMFVNSFKGNEFEEMFRDKLTAIGMWSFAVTMSLVSVKYLHLPYQKFMGSADDSLLNNIAEDIISGGNFGRKEYDRGGSSLFISSHGKNGTRTNTLKQAWISLSEISQSNWAVFRNHKLLRPFGVLYYCANYVVRRISGKAKKRNIRSGINIAKKRRRLYSELHIFELEK